jgi:hypothetical protein
MTKNELRSKIPQVRFSGKTKRVFIREFGISPEKAKILDEFCEKSGYKWK